MPIYEYRCSACGHAFERMQKMSDSPVRKCPKCGKSKVEKLVSRSAVKFEGSGWYVTDYAKKATPLKEKSDTAASPKDGQAANEKGEGKKEDSKKDAPPKPAEKKDGKK